MNARTDPISHYHGRWIVRTHFHTHMHTSYGFSHPFIGANVDAMCETQKRTMFGALATRDLTKDDLVKIYILRRV